MATSFRSGRHDYLLNIMVSQNNSLVNSYTASQTTTFTPTAGQSYASYGGCYYFKTGNLVHLHIGVRGLTPNANNNIYTLPAGYRPHSSGVCGVGQAGLTYTGTSHCVVGSSGVITVASEDEFAMIDVSYTAFG